MLKKIKNKFKNRFKNKLFPILAIILIVLVVAAIWFWQKNIYSKDVLKLEILGPDSADFAKSFDYTFKYKNNGSVKLEDAKLIFEYPDNAILDDDDVDTWREIELDDIYPGEEKSIAFSARLIGQEGQTQTAKATLSYKPKNLKAVYKSETSFTNQIKSFPLTFEFDMPTQVETGKDITFRVNYFSNVDYPLLNLRLTLNYPNGFEFINSNPDSLEKTEWVLSPLNKAEGGSVEITGNMQGEIGEQKMFTAKLGLWRDGEFILLKEISKGVEIVEPSLDITQEINGDENYIANPGDSLHYEIYFKNIGEDTLSNLTLKDTLSGDIFDLESLTAPDGLFTVGDNSVSWDWRKIDEIQSLDPLQTGKIEFWINLKDDFDIPSGTGNLTIKNNVNLGQAKAEFSTKVNTKLTVGQRVVFYDEVFGNSGPIPPKVGSKTTYTVTWQAQNYYNSVKNVKVKTVLPSYIQLTGNIFPTDSGLTLDSESREIVWDVGDLDVGQGVLNAAPNVSFQVSFTPTSSQRGKTPNIIDEVVISGQDAWTGELVEGILSEVNTTLPDDESVSGQGKVQ
jgi:uncharacterized repeat protein (TIGR01451 family)